jgi:hypothetical protein
MAWTRLAQVETFEGIAAEWLEAPAEEVHREDDAQGRVDSATCLIHTSDRDPSKLLRRLRFKDFARPSPASERPGLLRIVLMRSLF